MKKWIKCKNSFIEVISSNCAGQGFLYWKLMMTTVYYITKRVTFDLFRNRLQLWNLKHFRLLMFLVAFYKDRSRKGQGFSYFPKKSSEVNLAKGPTYYAVSMCTWILKCQFGNLLQTRKKNWLKNKLDFFSSSNLIFSACVACKNQLRNQIDFLIF